MATTYTTTYSESYVARIMDDAWACGDDDASDAIAEILHNLLPSEALRMLREWDAGILPGDSSPLSGEWADGRDYRDWLPDGITWGTDHESFTIVDDSITRYEEAYFGAFDRVLRPALAALIRD
jgi:hypothetical protein